MKKLAFNRIFKSLNSRRRPVLTVWLLLFTAPFVFAERLPVKIYTSADGLGSSFVDCLMRDSRGFMWFCTRDGLSRFDGAKFITYKFGGDNSAPGIENIIETRDGTYWVLTVGGIYRFKADAVAQTNPAENGKASINAEYIDNWRGVMLEDQAGNIWYGGDGLFSVKEHDGKVDFQPIELNIPPQNGRSFGINEMYEAADGSLWMNSNWGIARRLPDGRVIFYPFEIGVRQDLTSLTLDADGRVWLSRGLELFIFKPEAIETLTGLGQTTVKSLKPTRSLPSDVEKPIQLPETTGDLLKLSNGDFLKISSSKKLFQSADRHIWLTTQKELIEFDGRVFHLYGTAQGLPVNMARMAEDASGNLWIGGQTGLIRLDRRGLETYGEADGLNSNIIYAVNEDSEGALYIANGDFYISRLSGKKFQTARPQIAPDSVPLWTSRYALLSNRNEWWILTKERLYRFAADDLGKPLGVYDSRNGLKSNELFQIFEDSKGEIWVSVQPTKRENLGLARFDRAADKFYSFSEADGYPPGKSASSFAEDRFGNIWFGFYEGGLARYSGGKFQVFDESDGLSPGLMTDMRVDRQGRLWISSALRGLLRIDDPQADKPQIKYFTTAEGLSSNNVRTVTEDNFGNIYAGTVRGVDRISIETGRVKHYSIADGLASDFVVDSHCDKNGTLWFATTNGLSKLVPTENENATATKIWLGGLYIAGVEQNISALGDAQFGNIELVHTQNNLQIDFFGLDFRAGETLRYQYKLEGADSDWSIPTEQRTVTFANLQPGAYRFLVRAVNSDGVTSDTPAVVSFRILPPIWARRWFVLLCAVLVTVIIVMLYRYRTANLREINLALEEAKRAEENLRKSKEERLAELEKVRSRIATDLHDDIGASLTQIAVLSEVAQAQSRKENAAPSEPLLRISDVSNELVEAMSDIVWSINPAKDHLSDLTQRMRRFVSDILSAKGIGFQFQVADADREIIVNTNLRREVFLLFKESINNVVKHSGARQVRIELTIAGGNLNLRIADDGKGFVEANGATPSDNYGGNGILSMKKRAFEMNGKVEIVSAAGAGTTVELTLPLE